MIAWLKELFPDPKSYAEGRRAHHAS